MQKKNLAIKRSVSFAQWRDFPAIIEGDADTWLFAPGDVAEPVQVVGLDQLEVAGISIGLCTSTPYRGLTDFSRAAYNSAAAEFDRSSLEHPPTARVAVFCPSP
jgi:hypothetical protein